MPAASHDPGWREHLARLPGQPDVQRRGTRRVHPRRPHLHHRRTTAQTAQTERKAFVSRTSRPAYRAALAASAVALSALAFSIAVPAGPALAADTATINGGQTYQTIAGF